MTSRGLFVSQSSIHNTLWFDDTTYKAFKVKKLKPSNDIFPSQFVSKRIVNNHCPIASLRGSNGIFADYNLYTRTTVGYMLGTYFIEANWNKLTEPEKYRDYSVDVDTKIGTIVIVPNDSAIILRYLNDNRCLDRSSKRQIKSNVEFVTEMYANKLPLVKIQTTKYIKKNGQLYLNYGVTYWKSRGYRIRK